MRQLFIFAAVMLAAGVYVARMADHNGHAPAAPSASAMVAQPEPAPTSSNNSRSITLSPGNGGHFWTEARLDGPPLEFVVDTGAPTIALRESDAARLRIHPSRREDHVEGAPPNDAARRP